jgi:hypothetical protein
MRVLTVVFDRRCGDGAWIVVEHGLTDSRYRHRDHDEAVEEARRLAAFGRGRGDSRDTRLVARDHPVLVPGPDLASLHAAPVSLRDCG